MSTFPILGIWEVVSRLLSGKQGTLGYPGLWELDFSASSLSFTRDPAPLGWVSQPPLGAVGGWWEGGNLKKRAEDRNTLTM